MCIYMYIEREKPFSPSHGLVSNLMDIHMYIYIDLNINIYVYAYIYRKREKNHHRHGPTSST